MEMVLRFFINNRLYIFTIYLKKKITTRIAWETVKIERISIDIVVFFVKTTK